MAGNRTRSRVTRGVGHALPTEASSFSFAGTYDWHVAKDRFVSDAGLARIFSLDESDAARGLPMADFLCSIHPVDLPSVEKLIVETCEAQNDFAASFRVRQRGGGWRHVTAYGKCRSDTSGELHFFGAALTHGARGVPAAPRGNGNTTLPPREMQCLSWCSHGKTTWEIGKILGISERTVEHHIASALRRLGCTSRIHGVAHAIRVGLMK